MQGVKSSCNFIMCYVVTKGGKTRKRISMFREMKGEAKSCTSVPYPSEIQGRENLGEGRN